MKIKNKRIPRKLKKRFKKIMIEAAEAALLKLVEKGDPQAIRFYVRSKFYRVRKI